MSQQIFEKDIKKIYNQIKSSAKRRNIYFDLKLSELNDLSFPITCPIFDIPLEYHYGKAEDNSPSVDRIDSNKGYTIDNIVIISNRANRLKSDATNKELSLLANFYN